MTAKRSHHKKPPAPAKRSHHKKPPASSPPRRRRRQELKSVNKRSHHKKKPPPVEETSPATSPATSSSVHLALTSPTNVETFLAALEGQGYRQKTLQTYRKALHRLQPLLDGRGDCVELLRSPVLADLATSSRAVYLAALKGFSAWAREQGLILLATYQNVPRFKIDRGIPRPLTSDQLAKLDQAVDNLRPPEDSWRAWNARHVAATKQTQALYWLLRGTGCRIGEALALKWADVCLDAGREAITIREAKGRQDRVVPLMPGRLLSLLRERTTRTKATADDKQRPGVLLDATGKWIDLQRQPWHVVGHSSTPIHYQAALRRWADLCRVAGVVATPHQIRHTVATQLAAGGVSPWALRQVMGWARLDTAGRYVAVSPESIRAELRRVTEDDGGRPGARAARRSPAGSAQASTSRSTPEAARRGAGRTARRNAGKS